MRPTRTLFVATVASALGFVLCAAPGAACGDKTATYDWFCDYNHCSFDASASTQTVYKYYFDFGDGTSTGLSGSPNHDHVYDFSGYETFDVKLVLFYLDDECTYEVTCEISVENPPIGGVPPLSGTCPS